MNLGDVRNCLIIFVSRNSIILLKVPGLLLSIWLQVTSLVCGLQQQQQRPLPPLYVIPHLVPSAVLIVSEFYFVDTGSDFEKEEKVWPSVQGGGIKLYIGLISTVLLGKCQRATLPSFGMSL